MSDEWRERTLDRIPRTWEWTNWPLLPVKRLNGSKLELGVIQGNYNDRDMEPRPEVQIRNMFVKPPKDFKTYKYESFEALVDDGWRID